MSELTGINTASKMRDIRPEMPIILATGYSDAIGEKEVEQQGISFLKKPIATSELTIIVAEVLSNH